MYLTEYAFVKLYVKSSFVKWMEMVEHLVMYIH